jgi:protein-tyrosine phosphatase
MKILMVCLGNICRSPLAEGILQEKAIKAGLNWKVDSAGTGTWHIGQPPHHLSQKVATINKIDITQQRCRQFRKEDMLVYDFIYAMDKEIYNEVKTMSGELWNKNKVDLLLNELYKGEDRGVPDPYLGTESDYHEVFALINEACDIIIEKAKNKQPETSNQ